jgi:hypothetical protein
MTRSRQSSPEGHLSGVPSAEIGRKFVGAFTQAGATKTEGEALQILAAIVPLFRTSRWTKHTTEDQREAALVIMMALAQSDLLAS